MDPTFGLGIIIAIAGLSVVLSINAATEAINRVASAIRISNMDMQTSADILKLELQDLTQTLKDK